MGLQLNSAKSYGTINYAPGCANGVFLENDNSYCLYQGGTCHGNCCAFGDDKCDYSGNKDDEITVQIKDNINLPGSASNTYNDDVTGGGGGNNDEDAQTTLPENSIPPITGWDENLPSAGSVSEIFSKNKQVTSGGGCTGACIGLAVVIPILCIAVSCWVYCTTKR